MVWAQNVHEMSISLSIETNVDISVNRSDQITTEQVQVDITGRCLPLRIEQRLI